MARSRNRVCLQDGLRLDINSLARKGFLTTGTYSGVQGIGWTHSYWGEVASALISADLSDASSGWLKLEGGINQFILLAAQPRPFGGHQWYFVCPITGRLASVLWRPPVQHAFAASRFGNGKQLTQPNFSTETTERTMQNPRSMRGSVRSES